MTMNNSSTQSRVSAIAKPFTVAQLESKLEELRHLNRLALVGAESEKRGDNESAQYIMYLVQSKLDDLHSHYERLAYVTMDHSIAAMEASV